MDFIVKYMPIGSSAARFHHGLVPCVVGRTWARYGLTLNCFQRQPVYVGEVCRVTALALMEVCGRCNKWIAEMIYNERRTAGDDTVCFLLQRYVFLRQCSLMVPITNFPATDFLMLCTHNYTGREFGHFCPLYKGPAACCQPRTMQMNRNPRFDLGVHEHLGI